MHVEPLVVIDKLSAKLAGTIKDLAMTEAALEEALSQINELEEKLNNPKPEDKDAA